MPSPLVATKLHAPRRRPDAVGRTGLSARLQRGSRSKFMLVSAPAGFGKTTLLAEHIASMDGVAVAWLSLDQADNEPIAFWSHLIAALQTTAKDIGTTLVPILELGQSPVEPLLTALLNELAASPTDRSLILDDYHVIDRKEIHDGLTFLIERLPDTVHLVVSTRSDPPLPLSRLRARGELVEIRAADLRFTADEAAAYLNDTMRLNLERTDIAALALRTEGWIAALQLAALSIEGRTDATGFIANFAGNDRFVVDYLVEEVLDRQPVSVRRFLSRTFFLERLSGPLCDTVTGEPGSAAMLNALERANLFLIPLDARREWYRYHHLFADVLEAHFAEELAGERWTLHRRASEWFATNGERSEAIRHALAGQDFDHAAALIEYAVPELSRTRQEKSIRDLVESLPDDLVRSRPALNLALVGSLASAGIFDGVEDRLGEVEMALAAINQKGDQPTPLVADSSQIPAIPAATELYRTALAQVRGDGAAAIAHAERALALAPADEDFVRAGAAGFLGIAFWSKGDLEAAERAWTECRNGLRRAGRIADVMGTSIALADINLTLGRLRAAARVLEDALQLATEQRAPILRGTADIHAGLAEIHIAGGDVETAARHLTTSDELGELAGLPQLPHRWRTAMAQLRVVEGDPEGALDLLDDAAKVYLSDFFPNVRPIAAMRARILITQGRLAEAARWQSEVSVTADDPLTYLREFEHITLARLLLAEGGDCVEVAQTLLARLLAHAEKGNRKGRALEISILQALSYRDNVDAALDHLARALAIAEPEGFIQIFPDEGEPLAALFDAAVKRGISPAFARTLLAELRQPNEEPLPPRSKTGLFEPLSERERDVLRLLRSDLDGPEIARELKVSLNTMRTHTKNIYDKLGVNSRRAAVRRAEELMLLRTRPR